MLIFQKSFYHQCVLALALALMSIASCTAGESIRVYPAPAGEPLSTNFTVTIGSNSVPVYVATVATADPAKRRRISTRDELSFADTTSFASFDLHGSAQVSVECPGSINSAKILPASSGVTPTVSGNRVVFTVSKPCQLELDVNGDWVHSLQLFVNPMETDAPRPDDPNVIYFGPGRHEVEEQ